MKTNRPIKKTGFTLIELLTVIAIMAILAAFIMPITRAVSVSKIRNRARTEMSNLETAIETYKAKLGYYPPADPNQPASNPLYFELLGTTMTNATTYTTLDGSASIAANVVNSTFGVGGFLNCTRPGGGDDTLAATAFLGGLKPAQYSEIAPGVRILIGPAAPGTLTTNAWCYRSSSPAHNPKTFDLWIDITIAGKINRICNWSDQALIGNGTYP